MLDHLGLTYTMPHGSYFVLVDASNIRIPDDFDLPEQVRRKPRDYHVCWFVGKVCDVVAIPVTAFCSEEGTAMGERFIRFAFCKDGQMTEAGRRLQTVRAPRRLTPASRLYVIRGLCLRVAPQLCNPWTEILPHIYRAMSLFCARELTPTHVRCLA